MIIEKSIPITKSPIIGKGFYEFFKIKKPKNLTSETKESKINIGPACVVQISEEGKKLQETSI